MSSDTCFDLIISTVGKDEIAKSREGGKKKIKEKVKKRGGKSKGLNLYLWKKFAKKKGSTWSHTVKKERKSTQDKY